MPHTTHIDENGAKFDLTYLDKENDTYADGISQLQLGWPISKIVMHNVTRIATPDTPEERVVAQVLAMPTASLLQLAHQILHGLATTRTQLEEAVRNNTEQFLQSIPKLPQK